MKIGLIADSHDNKQKIRAAVSWFNMEKVALVLNAGDLVAPFTKQEYKNLEAEMICVFGNNDGEKLGLSKSFDIQRHPRTVEVAEKRILMLHEPDNLESVAKSGDYDLILYGHTHEKEVREVGETLVINPGECCGWLTGVSTAMIYDTETGKVLEKAL